MLVIHYIFALALLTSATVQAGRMVLALYALQLGADAFAMGLLAAASSILPMLMSFPAGKVTDRFGARWPLVFGAAGTAAGMLIPYFIPTLGAMYAAAALNGFSFVFYNVALQNLVGLLSEERDHAKNFSNLTLVWSVGGFVGPLLGGFSIDLSGYALSCLYVVGLALLPALILIMWGSGLPAGTRSSERAAGGIRTTLAQSGMWRILVACGFIHSGQDVFQFYMPVYAHNAGFSASAIGVVLAMYAAAAFLVRIGLPRLVAWRSVETVLSYAFFVGAASFLVMPFVTGGVPMAAMSFLFGLGIGCGQPITMMLTFTGSAKGRSGEALGLRLTVNHASRVVVPMIFGSIGSAFGVLPVFWVNALMLAAGGALSRLQKASAPVTALPPRVPRA